MIPRIAGVLLGIAVAFAVGIGAVITVGQPNDGAVYSLAIVQAGLARNPRAWVNHTIRVRAGDGGCTTWSGTLRIASCMDATGGLYDMGSPQSNAYIPVVDGATNPWLRFLRGIPLLRSLAPPSQRLIWGTPAIYWVQLRIAPAGLCAGGICVIAVLLDAAPDHE